MPASILERSCWNNTAMSVYKRLRFGTGASNAGRGLSCSLSRSRAISDSCRTRRLWATYQAKRGSWRAPYARRVAKCEVVLAMLFPQNHVTAKSEFGSLNPGVDHADRYVLSRLIAIIFVLRSS